MAYQFNFETTFSDNKMNRFGYPTSAENLDRIRECATDDERHEVHDDIRNKARAFVQARFAMPEVILADPAVFTPEQ